MIRASTRFTRPIAPPSSLDALRELPRREPPEREPERLEPADRDPFDFEPPDRELPDDRFAAFFFAPPRELEEREALEPRALLEDFFADFFADFFFALRF